MDMPGDQKELDEYIKAVNSGDVDITFLLENFVELHGLYTRMVARCNGWQDAYERIAHTCINCGYRQKEEQWQQHSY